MVSLALLPPRVLPWSVREGAMWEVLQRKQRLPSGFEARPGARLAWLSGWLAWILGFGLDFDLIWLGFWLSFTMILI